MESKSTILVVDDTPKNIQLVANILGKSNLYTILFAFNGGDALKRVQENDIALILLDIMMPDMDGFEVATILKSDPKYMDIPIIFITAFTDSESIKKGFDCGAEDYITKPFNPPELISRVGTHTKLYRAKKILEEQLNENISLLEQYKNAVDESDIVSKTDLNGRITYANNKFSEISQYTQEELLGKPHNIIRHPQTPKSVFEDLWRTIKDKKIWRGEVKNLKKDGSTYIVENVIVPILNLNGETVEYMSIRHDITDIYNLNIEIENTQRELVQTLGAVSETRSKETGNHVKRVAEYSYLLAKLYGLDEEECKILKDASPMHDIGKIGIPDDILNKPAKLTPNEFDVIKAHSRLGYDMLCHSERLIFKTASTIAYQHHEKYDGSGYPRGLKGEEIHIYGRITAIADVFDALGSDRCYKKSWEMDAILKLIKEESGKHFDPKLVELFLKNTEKFLEIRQTLKDVDYVECKI